MMATPPPVRKIPDIIEHLKQMKGQASYATMPL